MQMQLPLRLTLSAAVCIALLGSAPRAAANLCSSRRFASVKELAHLVFLALLASMTMPATARAGSPSTYVVNTTADDGTGVASNCTSTPEGTCTLRDALAASSAVSASNITFAPTVFLASNSAAANTILLLFGPLNIATNTSIVGLTSGSGVTLTNLVTVSGDNSTTVFTVVSSATGAAIANLNITSGNANDGNTYLYGGGIWNAGTLTVAGCTFTDNSADVGGGAIYTQGELSVTGSTFSNNSAPAGGGILDFEGELTVSRSTFTGNSTVTQYGAGGAIATENGDGLTPNVSISESTFSGNSAASGGALFFDNSNATMKNITVSSNSATGYANSREGGIGANTSTMNIANSIIEGNTVGEAGIYPDIESGYYNDLGGNQINGSSSPTVVNPNLSAVGYYGGSTKTMVPLPGSAAICGGLAANILAGVTTDQRGYPIKNTTYPGFTESTPCVDSGAVQTNYAIGFSTLPPSEATADVALSPAPVVSLSESGAPSSVSVGTVTMTDTASLLTGTFSEAITSGDATFGNLAISAATSGDIPDATMPLISSINLTAEATTAIDVSAGPAQLLTPTPGLSTILGTTNVQFTWSTGTGVTITGYKLSLGTTGVGSGNLYFSGVTSGTTATARNIPADGVTVFAQLGSLINGTWQYVNYVYTESGTLKPATLTPSSGTLATSQTFTWNNGVGPVEYVLLLGTIGQGSSNLYDSYETTATSTTVSIPSDGVTVYGTLRQLINDTWQVSRYTFTEPGKTTPATLTPLSGTLTSSQMFTWSNGAGPSEYVLLLGTTGEGSADLYNSYETPATSATVSIPSEGVTVFGTLRQLINGTWRVSRYTFTEPGTSNPATLTPSTGMLSASQTFTWNNGVGPVEYVLLVGTTGDGSSDIYNSGLTTATSATVTIPSNSLPVWATLRQLINGTWQVTRYTFIEP
jgi:CSLREA domain-containing protein